MNARAHHCEKVAHRVCDRRALLPAELEIRSPLFPKSRRRVACALACHTARNKRVLGTFERVLERAAANARGAWRGPRQPSTSWMWMSAKRAHTSVSTARTGSSPPAAASASISLQKLLL